MVNSNMKKHFVKIVRMTQPVLKKHCIKKLKGMNKAVSVGDGFVYAPGSFPVLICAHMDTVHKALPTTIVDKDNIISSPNGIGGDDRCGIVMCFEILKHVDCHVAFFEDEEIGGVGSAKFAKTDICKNMDIRFIIELDRKGNNDAVFYDCDNPEFSKFITKEFWKEDAGSFTDICNISDIIGVSSVNLSCGYYKQHTTSEYVNLEEMTRCTNEVIKLFARTDVNKRFEWIERQYKFTGYEYNLGSYYTASSPVYTMTYVFEYVKNGCYSTEYVDGYTEEDIFMSFMIDHPDICYNDIVGWYPADEYKNW